MQALAWCLGHPGKLFESDGGVNQIAENKSCSFRLTAQKQCCRFIEKRLGKLRIALDALGDGSFEVAGKDQVITFSRW